MMKRFIVLVAAVAAVSTVASGAVLQFHNLGTNSVDGSLSSGGNLVGGSIIDTSVLSYRFPAYWTTFPNTGAAPVRTNVNGGWGAGYFGGIDQKGAGSIYTAANAGSTVYSANNFIGRGFTPALSNLLDHNGAASMVTVGGNNATSATPNGTDAWVAGVWSAGGSKGNDGQIWLASSGVTALFHPTGTGKLSFRSIASNGNAIGDDNGGVGYTGFSPRTRAVYWTAGIGNGSVVPIPTFAGNGTTTQGQGFGVSDNGTYLSGLAYVANNVSYQGFRYAIGDANMTKLTIPTGVVTGTLAVAYDIADDGTAVGMSYIDDSNMTGGLTVGAANHEAGTIWWAGQTVGVRGIDALIAAGVYDSNIRILGRIYGIAKLADGKYAISGEMSYFTNPEHTTYENRAFYAVIPEPATLSFLALGGLALLRRRR